MKKLNMMGNSWVTRGKSIDFELRREIYESEDWLPPYEDNQYEGLTILNEEDITYTDSGCVGGCQDYRWLPDQYCW